MQLALITISLAQPTEEPQNELLRSLHYLSVFFVARLALLRKEGRKAHLGFSPLHTPLHAAHNFVIYAPSIDNKVKR